MFIKVENLKETKLIGKNIEMSYAMNKTFELWHSFMPIKNQITNVSNSLLFSVEVYEQDFFREFNPSKKFIKWAAVQVNEFEGTDSTFEKLIIPQGEYAVFLHKGTVADAPKTYGYIFSEWIPNSEFVLDNRPHLAIMGEKYKNNSPDSEEEIWIPIKRR